MQIKYIGEQAAVNFHGTAFVKDVPVEVDKELGKQLKKRPYFTGVRGRPSGNNRRVQEQGTEEVEGTVDGPDGET